MYQWYKSSKHNHNYDKILRWAKDASSYLFGIMNIQWKLTIKEFPAKKFDLKKKCVGLIFLCVTLEVNYLNLSCRINNNNNNNDNNTLTHIKQKRMITSSSISSTTSITLFIFLNSKINGASTKVEIQTEAVQVQIWNWHNDYLFENVPANALMLK